MLECFKLTFAQTRNPDDSWSYFFLSFLQQIHQQSHHLSSEPKGPDAEEEGPEFDKRALDISKPKEEVKVCLAMQRYREDIWKWEIRSASFSP